MNKKNSYNKFDMKKENLVIEVSILTKKIRVKDGGLK
jgi:hypothetical protein